MAEQTATNPQTGEKVVLRGGQWVPLGGAAPASPASQAGPVFGAPPKPEKPDAPKTSYRTLAPNELPQGLPPGSVVQESSEGNLDVVYKPDADKTKPPISEEDKAAVRAEAIKKLNLLASLAKRSRDDWFATGFGASTMRNFNGTSATDVANDVQTVGASGALNRVMQMAQANGGKNPLTPLSNSDLENIGKSITNLNPDQSDEQFQRNAKSYADVYKQALYGAGGSIADLEPETLGILNLERRNLDKGRIAYDGFELFNTKGADGKDIRFVVPAGASSEQIMAAAAKAAGIQPTPHTLDAPAKKPSVSNW